MFKPMLRLILLSALALFCAAAVSRNSTNTNHRVLADIRVGKLSVSGVIYKKLPIGGSSVLQFRRHYGLELKYAGTDSTKDTVDSKTFAAVVDKALASIKRSGGTVDDLQVDLNLVDSAWSGSVKAVKQGVQAGNGPLKQKDTSATSALRKSVRDSDAVREICSMVLRHGMKCAEPRTSVEHVAFQDKYVGGDRILIAKSGDAGISDQMWFSIKLGK